MNFMQDSYLDLNALRFALIRMEDTIIYGLIERSQYKHNPVVYNRGQFSFANNYAGSFMGYYLHETECLQAKIRRYESPDEYPFTKDLPEPILAPLKYPDSYKPNLKINLNSKILPMYRDVIVPAICESSDDHNYGSSVTIDILNLQQISKRIHYGKFVAEAKFSNSATHEAYVSLIKAEDREGLMRLLTDKEVEQKVFDRVKRKVMMYAQLGHMIYERGHLNCFNINWWTSGEYVESDHQKATLKLNPEVAVELYEKYIVPLTKEVEVEYLLRRLDIEANDTIINIGCVFDAKDI